MFDPKDIAFPLCCCPREPVTMGQPVALPSQAQTMASSSPLAGGAELATEGARIVEQDLRSIAAGVLEVAGGSYLVVRHEGHVVADTAEGRMITQRRGYSLIDIATCLPKHSAWKARLELQGKPSPPFAIVRSNGTR